MASVAETTDERQEGEEVSARQKDFKFQRGDFVRLVTVRKARWIVIHQILTTGEAGSWRSYRIKYGGLSIDVIEMEIELADDESGK